MKRTDGLKLKDVREQEKIEAAGKLKACIALDLDGTTLNNEGQLSDQNKEAIEYAISKGVHIIIASGRAYNTLPRQMVELPGIEYAVTSNGAAVCRVPEGEVLQGLKLKKEVVHKILELTEDQEIVYEAFVDGNAYADLRYVHDPVKYGASKEAVDYVRRTRKFVEDMPAFLRDQGSALDSMDIVVKDAGLKEQILKLLEEVREEIYVTSSVPQLIEISDKNSGKAAGLRYLKDHLGIAKEHMAAIGNADNDRDMIAYAKYGYAVENASSACKEAADMILRANDRDGVAQGIYDFLEKLQGNQEKVRG